MYFVFTNSSGYLVSSAISGRGRLVIDVIYVRLGDTLDRWYWISWSSQDSRPLSWSVNRPERNCFIWSDTLLARVQCTLAMGLFDWDMMEGLHQGLRMPGLYQKEDDKVAEYNNDGPTMIRIRYVMFTIMRPLRTIRIYLVTSMSPNAS